MICGRKMRPQDQAKDSSSSNKGGGNRRLISLLFAGLPIEWIQVLGFKNSIGSLKTTRSRLRDTIKTAHPEDEKLFLEMLETKRGPHNKISG